ncbi:hypothetical protein Sjap_008943 [Stephania japonica]|uniref:Uncharacterized protein n=1 Tax=Stephania japonica TaxID=461633 RepID=A0AAP0JR92_9MAGN
MSTKVIFSFVIEHILLLSFMLMLFLLLWFCTTEEMKNVKDIMGERNRQLFEKGEGSLMHRVKRWYMYSCMNNSQMQFCTLFEGMTVEIICLFCSTILLQAAYRSLASSGMEFCKGTSDYGWSMRAIIMSQITIVIVGSSTIAFRWLTLSGSVFFGLPQCAYSELNDFALHFFATKMRAMKTSLIVTFRLLLKVVTYVICKILVITVGFVPTLLLVVLSFIVESIFPPICQIIKGVSISSWKEFLGIVVGSDNVLPEWIMVVCAKDMTKWRSDASKRFSSGSYMAQMLSRPHPSVQSTLLNKIQEIGRRNSNGYKVTCLSMVLVKIVGVLVPSSLSESLRQAMGEAFEVIYFIDERINIGNFEDRRRREVAKLLWKGGDLNVKKKDSTEYNTFGEYLISTFSEVYEITHEKHMEIEVQIIRDFIQDCEYTSVEELCDYIYQLFVDMLRLFLTQFPALIFKEVHESPVEDYEERSRFILKLLFKLEPSLEDKVQWSFPVGANITRFLDPYENFDKGIPSDTTVGDAATVEVPSMTDSIPSIQDVEVGQTPMS